MSRYSIAGRATVVGTSARAIASLFGIAGIGGWLVECGVCNTTSTAVAVALQRFSAATNVGAGLTEAEWDSDIAPAPQLTGFAGHTGDGTVAGGFFRHAPLGAAVGATHIWTFPPRSLLIQPGTANGIGIVIPTGTGQICDYWFDWEE